MARQTGNSRIGIVGGRVVLLLWAALAACALSPGDAAGKGVGISPAPAGVAMPGSPYRYVTLSPGLGVRMPTIVQRIDRNGGRIDRWWRLRGRYYVPAVAYDLSGGGLSADGRTLLLQGFTPAYPPKTSRFAVLNTAVHLRHPIRPGEERPAHAVRRIAIPGFYSVHATSPDGSIAYLTRHFPRRSVEDFELRGLDLASGRLLPPSAIDAPGSHRMEGVPVTQIASRDGRWAYTLYDDGGIPFLLALDTVEGRIARVQLPRLRNARMAPATWGRRLLGGLAGLFRGSEDPLLAFARTPRHPGNLLVRSGVVGHSEGRPVTLRQYGDPRWSGELLVFGAGRIEPRANGCPYPGADIFLMPGRPDRRLARRIVRALEPEATIWLDPQVDDRSSTRLRMSRELVRIGRWVRED